MLNYSMNLEAGLFEVYWNDYLIAELQLSATMTEKEADNLANEVFLQSDFFINQSEA